MTEPKKRYWIYTTYGVRFTSADRVSIDENNTLRFEIFNTTDSEPVYALDFDNPTEFVEVYRLGRYELIGAYSDDVWKSFGVHLSTDEVEEDEVSE